MQESQQQQMKKMRLGACGWLRYQKVLDLVLHKRRLVEVPYTATLAHTVNALVANCIVAVPVAAPPGRWIGAGGSMILESDPATGVVRKHYIGMVTMLDVLVHIAEEVDDWGGKDGGGVVSTGEPDLEKKMAVPVYDVIGHSLEGLSLWTLSPNTRDDMRRMKDDNVGDLKPDGGGSPPEGAHNVEQGQNADNFQKCDDC